MFGASTHETRGLSVLAVAAHLRAVGCVRFLLMNGAVVQPAEIGAAFRGGSVEWMRLLWDAFQYAKPLDVVLKAVQSWNATGLRWVLDHKKGAISFHDLVRLFR
jgi:hypothetical protein